MLEGAAAPAHSPDSELNGGVSCGSASSCFAVGVSLNAGRYAPLAERWTGGTWSLLTAPTPARASASLDGGVACSSRTKCTAVGYFRARHHNKAPLAESWNGRRWSIERPPKRQGWADTWLVSVSCPRATECMAIGFYEVPPFRTGERALAELWNGHTWSISHPKIPRNVTVQLADISCPSGNTCTAVGDKVHTRGAESTTAERWTG